MLCKHLDSRSIGEVFQIDLGSVVGRMSCLHLQI